MSDRYADAPDRLKRAAVLLLTDDDPEGQMLLQLLIDNRLYGDELMFAVESAEKYLGEKGRKL